MKIKSDLPLLTIMVSIFLILSSYTNAAAIMPHFSGFSQTNKFCAYAGTVTIDGTQAVDAEDEVGAFVSDGSGGEILVGASVMGDPAEGYYFVTIYGDDTTTQEKDGALANDVLIFKVWDKSTNTEFTIPTSSMSVTSYAGATDPQIPPLWSESATFASLDLAAVSEPGSITGTIAYAGPDTGTIRIGAATDEEMSNIVSLTTIPSPGAFTITDLPPGDYYVGAFMDTTGSGQNEPQEGDPQNMLQNPVTVPSGGSVDAGTLTLYNPATKLVFSNGPLDIGVGAKGDMTVQLQDDNGNPASVDYAVIVGLSTTSANGKFYNGAGDTEINSVTIDSGSTSASFKYYDEAIGTPTITGANDDFTNATQAEAITEGAPASLEVTPENANLTADQTQQFSVTAYDAFGHEVATPTPVTWEVVGGIGTIDNNGLFNAGHAGTGTVQANAGGLSDTNTAVVVTPGALASFNVSPNTATVNADQTQQFTVINGKDSDDNAIADIGAVTWSVNGSIGSIDANGLFNASTVGTGSVTATKGEVTDNSGNVIVTPGAPNSIKLTSSRAAIVNNGTDTIQIIGTILDQDGNTVTGYSANNVVFTVDNTTLATFNGNATGTVAAASINSGVATITLNSVSTEQTGQVQISAASGGLVSANPASLSIEVMNKILVSISIETIDGGLVNNTSPKVGETVQFKATGHYKLPEQEVDPDLDDVITNTVTWNSSDQSKGTLDADGLFSAEAEGATNVTAASGAVSSNAIAMNVQPAEPVVIDETKLPSSITPGTEVDFGAVTSGGTGAGFTYAIDSQPAGNKGTITEDGKFNVDPTGAFAGEYVISATDDNSGASATFQIKVPLLFVPNSKNIMPGDSFDLVIKGAASGSQISDGALLDENGSVIPDDEVDSIVTINPEEPPPFNVDSQTSINITGKDVTELTIFQARVVVTGDDALTEENGLNTATSGWYRIIPGATYSGLVQDEAGNPIGGATVQFRLANKIMATATTADGSNPANAAGTFQVTGLQSPTVTMAQYEVTVMATNFITRTDITTQGWNGERTDPIELTAQERTVTGTVTETNAGPAVSGALIKCTIDGQVYTATSANDGTYTLYLPNVENTEGLTLRASKDGYTADSEDFADSVDFALTPIDTNNVVSIGTDGGSFSKGTCDLDIPEDALPADSDVDIDDTIPVGDSTNYTGNSVTLVQIDITDPGTGDPVALQAPIQVTIPFDTSKVDPGDFKNGKAIIYHADTVDDLKNGLGTAVPASDIIYEDHINGEVTFLVRSLSVFGIGGGGGGSVDVAEDNGGGCFITTASQDASVFNIGLIILFGLVVAVSEMVRRKVTIINKR